MAKNVFTTFLEAMKVKYTSSFSNKLFEEHPYKYTLYGLSQLLNSYHIDNVGVKISDKDINKLEPPFVAHIGTDFVVVDNISESTNDVHYLWNWKNTQLRLMSSSKCGQELHCSQNRILIR